MARAPIQPPANDLRSIKDDELSAFLQQRLQAALAAPGGADDGTLVFGAKVRQRPPQIVAAALEAFLREDPPHIQAVAWFLAGYSTRERALPEALLQRLLSGLAKVTHLPESRDPLLFVLAFAVGTPISPPLRSSIKDRLRAVLADPAAQPDAWALKEIERALQTPDGG